MKQIITAIALFYFSSIVFAGQTEIDLSETTTKQIAKSHHTEVDYAQSPILLQGSLGDDEVVKVLNGRSTSYYRWYKLLTNGKSKSQMRGITYLLSCPSKETNKLKCVVLNDIDTDDHTGTISVNEWESNGDGSLYEYILGDDYTGDIYFGIYAPSELDYKLEIFDLGEENEMVQPLPLFKTNGGQILYENIVPQDFRTKPEVGDIVKIAAVPAAGYKWEGDLNVKVGSRELCLMEGNAFVMPKDDISVSATFIKTDEDGDENPNPDNGNEGGNQNPTDVNEVNVSAQSIVGEKFHTVLGQPLSEPQESGVTVVTRTYSDGAVRSSKEVR